MRSSLLRSAAVMVTAGAMVALGTSSALADTKEGRHVVEVVGDGSSVHLDRTSVEAGSLTFKVSSTALQADGGSSITMFRLKPDKTLADVAKGYQEEFSPATGAQGTRDLKAAATFYGLADVARGVPMAVTETLRPGTYYLADSGTPPASGVPSLTTLTVRGDGSETGGDGDRSSRLTVTATMADRFVAPKTWPHEGTLTFENVSDTLHFMAIQRVQPGTKDEDVQAYLDSGAQTPPPFALLDRPSGGIDVVSPDVSLRLTYDLPAGTYVLLCFVADETTGMPHAVMGMHKVVVLD